MASVARTEVVIKATDQFTGKVERMNFSVEKFNASMNTLGKVSATLGASFASLTSVSSLMSKFGSFVSSGVKLNVMMENASVGMSGVLLNMTKIHDRQLKWNEAMQVSQGIIKDLNKAAMVTAATPSELIGTFSGLLGIGLGRGLTIDELKQFTVMGVNAVKSMGLDGRQLIQELRDLLQGSISAQKSSLATALGLSGADIKKAQNSADGLFRFLYERMKGFETSAQYFPKTIKGSFDVVKGALEMAFAEASQPAIDTVKEILQGAFSDIYSTNSMRFKPGFITPLNEIGESVNNVIKSLSRIGEALSPTAKIGLDLFKTGLNDILGNLDKIIVGMIAWKTFMSMTQASAQNTKVAMGQIKDIVGTFYGKESITNTYKSSGYGVDSTIMNALDNYQPFRFKKKVGAVENYGNKVLTGSLDAHAASLTNLGLNATIAAKAVNGLYRSTGGFGKGFSDGMKDLTSSAKRLQEVGVRIDDLGQKLVNNGVPVQQAVAYMNNLATSYNLNADKIKTAILKIKFLMNAQSAVLKAERIGTLAGGGLLAVGTISTTLNKYFNNDTLGKIGEHATQIGVISLAVGQLAGVLKTSLVPALNLVMAHPVIAGVTAVTALLSTAYMSSLENDTILAEAKKVGINVEEYRKTRKFGSTTMGGYGVEVNGGYDYNAIKLQTQAKLTLQRKAEEDDKIRQELQASQRKQDEANEKKEEKRQSNLIKRWEDVSVLEKDVIAKTKAITSSPYEAQMASLDKEIEQLNKKTQTAVEGLKQLGESQEKIDDFQSRMTRQITELGELRAKKIKEAYDIEIHWDSVMKSIKDTSFNNTQAFIDGFNSLTTEFTNFGQNIITEGGSFFQRFDDMLKNFANSIINTMMKIYMQGLLTRSIMGIFSGGTTVSMNGYAGSGLNVIMAKSLFGGGYAKGGIAEGWSLVGEQGAELVNFSNPGRVYTAQETAKAINGGGISNVKVEVINNTGTQATAESDVRFDGENYIINVVMNAVSVNKNNMRNMLKGAMA